MRRDWKPGDVALVTYSGTNRIALVRPRRSTNEALEFAYVKGGYDMVSDVAVESSARPLVVIDAEAREQVERLALLIYPGAYSGIIDGFQAALREFANPTPPKPDEPTGLGAVVFAVCQCEPERKRFVRDDTGSEFAEHPWKSHCGHHVWADLDVRDIDDLLAEGVRP